MRTWRIRVGLAHNDSGNEPALFALTVDGDVLQNESFEGAYAGIEVKGSTLKDWEAITRCGDKLYIAEMGNNLNASGSLGLYEVKEPDPRRTDSVSSIRFIEVRYPDQKGFPPTDRWGFDCEAAFCLDEKLYFVTKNRPAFRLFVQEGSANLYRLDLNSLVDEGANILEPVDRVGDLGGWVTAADMSVDGRWMAVLCESPTQSIWLFEKPEESEKFFSEPKSIKRYQFWGGGQLESLAFAKESEEKDEALFMVNEEGDMFRVDLDKFEEIKQ